MAAQGLTTADTEAQLEVIIPQAAPLRSICLNSGLEPAAEATHVLGRGDEGFYHLGRDVVAVGVVELAELETVAVEVRVRA
ncbi:MAG TPA: hypothetical protein VF521_04220, partial [Pyrinomonadaceae bacterium]